MAGSVNKVILIGNLGKDPEVRSMSADAKVANLTLATSENWTNKQTGNKEERTEWHRLVLYRQQAEIAEKYLKKGSKIYAEGKLTTRKWTDKENQERYTTEIVVDNFTMLDGKRDGESSGGGYDQSPRSSAPSSAKPMAAKQISNDAPFDDEIPF